MDASTRWAAELASWALPPEVLAQAPESPWAFDPAVFAERTRTALAEATPTHERCLEALPPDGSVLDVGAGTGAASLPLVPPAGRLVAVDESTGMLEQLRELAGDRFGLDVVVGRWPDAASQVGQVDVAVCANVVYNVADLGPFLTALTAAARERVVLELTATHPQTSLSWLWRHFWGIERPTGPVAADAVEVVRQVLGVEVGTQTWSRRHPPSHRHDPVAVEGVRRRLCLPADRDAEIAALLAQAGAEPMDMVTAWWTPVR